jgi:ABC-type Co2+ transport system permease subunit
VVAALRIPPPGWRARSGPRLLGGLFVIALVIGAVGQHLVLSGDSGPLVTGLANAIPQVICLIVAGGLVTALLDTALGSARPERGE